MQKPSNQPRWKHRARAVVRVAIVLQLLFLAVYVGALAIGERSYASFFALYLPRHPLLVASACATVAAVVLKHRGLIASQVVALAIVLFPVMGLRVHAPSAARDGAHTVRLATWNVYFGKAGRPQLLDEIAAMPADVIVLEAGYDSLGARLRERLPDRTIHQEGELAMLTRLPIVDVEVPPLLPGEVKPMFVGYVLQTSRGPLRVFVTHPFSPRNALMDRDERWDVDVARREAQVAAVVAAARRPGPPVVIAGDTNLPTWSVLARRELSGFADAFEEAGSGFGYTFPAKRPWMRIDRVFGGPGIRFVGARVGDRGASDHRPLFVELEL